MPCDAQTLISNAVSNGYSGMSDRDLKMAVLAAACAGGGGGPSGLSCGVGIPVAAPIGTCGFYIRQQGVSTALYAWDGAAWQAVVGT